MTSFSSVIHSPLSDVFPDLTRPDPTRVTRLVTHYVTRYVCCNEIDSQAISVTTYQTHQKWIPKVSQALTWLVRGTHESTCKSTRPFPLTGRGYLHSHERRDVDE
jgi:hypothetical protein